MLVEKKKHQEHILAIPAVVANKHIPVVYEKYIGLIDVFFDEDDLVIARRSKLENNPDLRQLISYVPVKCKDKYAAYRRTPKGNESRLHGQVSIGFGGHSDLADLSYNASSIVDLTATLELSMKREISEELDLNGAKILSFKILDEKIVSNLTEVDRVHIGIVAIIELDSEVAKSAENQLDFIGFMTLDELDSLENKENWTTALINHLRNI